MAEERRQSSYYTATTDCSDRGESAVDQHRHPNGFLQPRYEHQHMAASPSLSIPQPFQTPYYPGPSNYDGRPGGYGMPYPPYPPAPLHGADTSSGYPANFGYPPRPSVYPPASSQPFGVENGSESSSHAYGLPPQHSVSSPIRMSMPTPHGSMAPTNPMHPSPQPMGYPSPYGPSYPPHSSSLSSPIPQQAPPYHDAYGSPHKSTATLHHTPGSPYPQHMDGHNNTPRLSQQQLLSPRPSYPIYSPQRPFLPDQQTSSSLRPVPPPLSMPMPDRWSRYQAATQPAAIYPPPGFVRPPSEDYISKYRSSTVQPSLAAAAEEYHRESIRSSLRRASSHKHAASTPSDDDDEDSYLYNKPLPPPPAPEQADEMDTVPSTDPALLSVISKLFVKRVKELKTMRELSFGNEHSDAFTGQEAVNILCEILLNRYPSEHCLKIANALMHCKPKGLFVPVDRSEEKTDRMKPVYGSPDEIYALVDVVPVGVFTGITRCYVQGCVPGQGGCYAPRCPNKPAVYQQDVEPATPLLRGPSTRSSYQHIEELHSRETWGGHVPREFYDSIDKRERDRQEAINEVIHSEELYQKDLELLHEAIVLRLKESQAIDPDQEELFVQSVFNNYDQLRCLSIDFADELLQRQDEYDQQCIPGIADIMLKHLSRFRDPYATYVPNVHLAEYIVADTKRSNEKFRSFLEEVQHDTKLNKQSFRHFLLRPVMRLPRYVLLIEAIMKKTNRDDPEYEKLEECKRVVSEVATLCDQLAASVKNRVEILMLNDALTCRQGEFYDLKLTDPCRKIYFRGDLKRDNGALELSEKYIHVVLLDHMLLLTKARKTSEGVEYRIWRRPIPLQMLYIPGLENGFKLPTLYPSTSAYSTAYNTAYNTYNSLKNSATIRNDSLTLTFIHPGRHGGEYYFACNSQQEKQQWLAAIDQAKRDLSRQADAFELDSIERSFFKEVGSSGDVDGHGKITCSVPFVSEDKTQKIAIGTTTGVYFKNIGDDPPRAAISLKDGVTQLAVMEKQRILLVLTDKCLQAYPLDTLTSKKNIKAPDRLVQEIADHVQFFEVGICNGMELLVYARQKTLSTSFVVLKPTTEEPVQPEEHRWSGVRHFFRHSGSTCSWFEVYKEFLVGARAIGIHFLKSKFAVVCERAFEIIDPENLSTGRSIPDKEDPQFKFLEQRSDDLKPLAMYRVQDKFLLCYNKFAFYVSNKTQSLIPRDDKSDLLCEWECHPERIVYHHPYVIAFDQRFIEIRHVVTGDLAQLITSNDCCLTYFNGNSNTGEKPLIQGCIVYANRPAFQDLFQLLPYSQQPSQ